MKRRNILTLIFFVIVFYLDIAISYSNFNGYESTDNFNHINFKRRITNEQSSIPALSSLDNHVKTFMDRWGIVGASVALVKDGKLLYAKGFGYANQEQQKEVQPEHLFRVASISKLITAVAVMKLVEEGSISLDDRVFGKEGILNDSIYLNFRDRKVKDITVKHLLEHSGGWSTRAGDPMFATLEIANRLNIEAPAPPESIIQYILKRHRLYFRPGTRSYYSNFGYVVLGEIIEKVTHSSYEDFVRKEVLAPIGIVDMYIGKNLYEERYKGEVTYYDKPGAPLRLSCYGDNKMVPRTYGGTNVEALGSAGGWIASSVDLMRLLVSIDGLESKPDILTEESIKLMTSPEVDHLSPLGWRATSGEKWWRTGTLAGTSAILERQNEKLSWVMVVNTSTWRGARFSRDMKYMMEKAVASVNQWPDHDLFNYQLPMHVSPIPPKFMEIYAKK